MNITTIKGKRFFFFGKLAGLNKRQAAGFVRDHGGIVSQTLSDAVNIVVVGEAELLAKDFSVWSEQLDEQTRAAFEKGTLDIQTESAFWEFIFKSDSANTKAKHFTAAMLADLLDLPIATIRLWQRLGLIVPVELIHKLAYFDINEVLTAKALRELLQSGIKPELLEKRLRSIKTAFPDITKPLAQLLLIVEGKDVLLKKGDILLDQRGQGRIDFDALDNGSDKDTEGPDKDTEIESDELLECVDKALRNTSLNRSELCEQALALEESGEFESALEVFRTALITEGADPVKCLHVAELLYRLGDLTAARERYYMVLELDEENVEARASLGCVLAELGQGGQAIDVFEGALRYHPDYTDVYYHLGMVLWQNDRKNEAIAYLRKFLESSPESPLAERVWDFLDEFEPALT